MIQSKKDDLFGAWVAVVVVLPVVSFLIAGGFVFFWQCVKWLESAVWPHLTLRDGLALGGKRWITYRPDSGWLGFDQLRTWLLDDTPLPVFLLMFFYDDSYHGLRLHSYHGLRLQSVRARSIAAEIWHRG